MGFTQVLHDVIQSLFVELDVGRIIQLGQNFLFPFAVISDRNRRILFAIQSEFFPDLRIGVNNWRLIWERNVRQFDLVECLDVHLVP